MRIAVGCLLPVNWLLTIILRLCPHIGRGPARLTRHTVSEFSAMRKMLMALLAMFLMAGLVVAVEVTLVSFDKDKKELKVKEGDDEKTYKIDDKTKFITTDKDGNAKDSDLAAFEKRADKSKNKKYDITVKDGTVTEVKWKGGKGK
jgi:hypothetical protein